VCRAQRTRRSLFVLLQRRALRLGGVGALALALGGFRLLALLLLDPRSILEQSDRLGPFLLQLLLGPRSILIVVSCLQRVLLRQLLLILGGGVGSPGALESESAADLTGMDTLPVHPRIGALHKQERATSGVKKRLRNLSERNAQVLIKPRKSMAPRCVQ
jgi:hypothetical protein